ncbi:MAG: N-acetyltransferase [Planctomycetes bacterium]|nr:N-acetyltransferase [Planctomycetota bacterium]
MNSVDLIKTIEEFGCRPEHVSDHDAVRQINTQAFGGASEALLVDRLRGCPGSISLVATVADAVVGHILFTAATVVGKDTRVAGLGPMAVDPLRQRRGIGSAMVLRGLDECRRAGYGAVVVVGHAEYYPRFGFRRGSSFGLRCQFDVPDEVFMATELRPGVLSSGGELQYDPAFSQT